MNSAKQAAASKKTRVQNLTGDQTVNATPAVLQRVVIRNADAAVQTLTLKDGAATQLVISVGAGQMFYSEFGCLFSTSLVVNPSNANVDALVVWD